jgi:hypothetical protein
MNKAQQLHGFDEKSTNCYSIEKRQLFFAFGGAVIVLIAVITAPGTLFTAPLGFAIAGAILYTGILAVGLFLIALGLFRVETEINLNTRKASITKKNFRGQKSTREFALDTIGITGIRMGAAPSTASGVSTRERWIVKAGFQTEDYDTAIYSQETADEEERNKVMLDLHRFFFPDDTRVSERNIKADANKAILQKPG